MTSMPAGANLRSSGRRAGFRAKRATQNTPWIDRLARIGLAARGLVYLLVGYFAVQMAFGHPTQQANRQGAFQAIAQHSWGKALLWVMTAGFIGYALWRLSEAFWGHRDEPSGGKRLAKRFGSFCRAVAYAFITYSAIKFLTLGRNNGGAGGGSGGGKLLGLSFGRPLVLAIGIGLVIGGVALIVRGLKTKFEKHLKTGQMSPAMRRVVEKVGLVGLMGRGFTFGLVGIFFIDAAVTYDPKKADGLDAMLRDIARHAWGDVVLVVVGIGLVAFGLYSFIEARYRRTGQEHGSSPYPSRSRESAATHPVSG